MKQICFVILIVAVLLTSCNAQAATRTPSVDIDATVNSRVSGTISAMPTSTAWPTYTAIPKPTNTPRPSATPKPTATPQPEGGTRQNPYPYRSTVSLVQNGEIYFQISVSDVKRGDGAWKIIYAANQFNEKPPVDMEYIIATVVITYTGEDKGALQMDKRGWVVVTNGQVFKYSAIPTVCCIQGELEDVTVFAGGKAKGIMVWPVYVDDPNPLLVASMENDGAGGIYFSTSQ